MAPIEKDPENGAAPSAPGIKRAPWPTRPSARKNRALEVPLLVKTAPAGGKGYDKRGTILANRSQPCCLWAWRGVRILP